jgi:hypothetical protein
MGGANVVQAFDWEGAAPNNTRAFNNEQILGAITMGLEIRGAAQVTPLTPLTSFIRVFNDATSTAPFNYTIAFLLDLG